MRVVEQFATAAPARILWSTLQDVIDWPKWTPTVSRVEALDSVGLRMGARFRVYQPRLHPTIYVVTSLKQGEAFTWSAHMPGATLVAEHAVFACRETSRVELSFEISGWLAKLLEWRYRGLIMQYVATEARSLKARCEAIHAH
jgi:hypothetical protein